jgi:hypothetical protein
MAQLYQKKLSKVLGTSPMAGHEVFIALSRILVITLRTCRVVVDRPPHKGPVWFCFSETRLFEKQDF